MLPVRDEAQRGSGDRAGRLDRVLGSARSSALVAVVTSLAMSAIYAVLGTGFVLDDWFTLRNAHFLGAWQAAGASQRTARPGAAVVYAFVFGVLGRHPLAVLALQAVIGAATAGLLVVALRALFAPAPALAASLLWVVLPNHSSLEVWASATNIAVCVLLAVAALALLVSPRRWAHLAALVLFALAALCYEAVIPVAAALIVVVPYARRGRVDRGLVAGGAVSLGLVALWIVTHWHPDKHVAQDVADLGQMIGAHFGWGIVPPGPVASILTVGALVGMAVAVGRLVLASVRPRTGMPERLVVVGVAVIVLGTLPFAKYLYAPLGAGDRFNFASSIGGALVWTGLGWLVWAWRRPAGLLAMALLVGAAGVSRVERSVLWHRAGHDALAIQHGVVAAIPAPTGTLVIGPRPIQQQNIAAYLDQSNIDGALQLAYDDPTIVAGVTFSDTQFAQFSAASRFDIRTVSTLHPDTEVTAG